MEQARQLTPERRPTTAGGRVVVAVVLTWRSRIGLFKRSEEVAHDAGRWHCVTGYLEDMDPLACAVREIHEETGLAVSDLDELRTGPVLTLTGRNGAAWIVHTFIAGTTRRRLRLNWEHVDHRWVRAKDIPRFDGQVSWLSEVFSALNLEVGPRVASLRAVTPGDAEEALGRIVP